MTGVERDAGQCRHRKHRGDSRLVRQIRAVEQAERDAFVPDVHEVQQPGNDGSAVIEAEGGVDHRLGHLISHDDADGGPPVARDAHGRTALGPVA